MRSIWIGWVKGPKGGIAYFASIVLLMLVMLFLLHFYIANVFLNRDLYKQISEQESVVKSRKTLHSIKRLGGKQEVIERIHELNNIKVSVNEELVSLEKRRQHLLDDLTKYNMKIDSLRLVFDKENFTFEKLKLSRLNLEIELDELRSKRAPNLEAPLYLEMPIRTFSHSTFHESSQCTMTTCFDFSQCSLFNHFPIYVYDSPSSIYSPLAKSIIKHLQASFHFTKIARKACLYVYVLEDNLASITQFNKKILSLKYWNSNTSLAGINHVIINSKNTSIYQLFDSDKKLKLGKAIIAQESFHLNDFRRDFDVVLPPLHLISTFSELEILPMMVPVKRKHLLSFTGTAPASEHLSRLVSVLNAMQHTHPDDSFMFNFTCHQQVSSSDFIMCDSDILQNSTFSLIPVFSHITSSLNYDISTTSLLFRLINSIKSGAIPVIMCQPGSVQLPLEGLVDWSGAVVWLPAPRVTELHFYLRSFIDADIFEMRRRGRLIHQQFFSSLSNTINSFLYHLRKRLQIPPPAIQPFPSTSLTNLQTEDVPSNLIESDEILGPVEAPFSSPTFLANFSSAFLNTYPYPNILKLSHLYPNLPFKHPLPFDAKFIGSSMGFRSIAGGMGGAGKEFKGALGGDHTREQFTILMLTYEREAVLLTALSRFKGLPYLNRVVVVWNSAKSPSNLLRWPDIGVPIEVLKMKTNSLNNRFLPFSCIKTEAVLSLDDDVHLRHDEIIFAFRVWRQNRDQIVGFPGRFVSFDKHNNNFLYNSNYSCEMSMVLTGGAFIHQYYLYAYTYTMPAIIRKQVDSLLNCEDIAMNFLVSHLSRKPPIKVTSRWTFKCPGCSTTLYDDSTHFEERSQCVNSFISIYGYLPLLTTQFRADSILFKTRIPHDKQKCFKYV